MFLQQPDRSFGHNPHVARLAQKSQQTIARTGKADAFLNLIQAVVAFTPMTKKPCNDRAIIATQGYQNMRHYA